MMQSYVNLHFSKRRKYKSEFLSDMESPYPWQVVLALAKIANLNAISDWWVDEIKFKFGVSPRLWLRFKIFFIHG